MLKARSSARLACAISGIATAESKFTGYHRLCWKMAPYTRATSAIAAPPTIPPLTPAEIG